MLSPIFIKNALDVKKWLEKNPLVVLSMFTDVVESKDKTGFITVFEFKFETKKEAEMFLKLHEIAEKVQLTG